MKAVVFHAIGDIRVEDVPEPTIEDPKDAIVRLTASAICGTELHFVRGTFSGMKKGQILGHEGVGIVESVGGEVRDIRVGQRVIIPSTVGCGVCQFCTSGFFAQCDNANPMGKRAGTVFFGGPEAAGGLKGLQAEKSPCAVGRRQSGAGPGCDQRRSGHHDERHPADGVVRRRSR